MACDLLVSSVAAENCDWLDWLRWAAESMLVVLPLWAPVASCACVSFRACAFGAGVTPGVTLALFLFCQYALAVFCGALCYTGGCGQYLA